jgi:ferritin
MNNCFEKIFEHEVDNTNSIYKVVQMSLQEQDWATWNFSNGLSKNKPKMKHIAMDLFE